MLSAIPAKAGIQSVKTARLKVAEKPVIFGVRANPVPVQVAIKHVRQDSVVVSHPGRIDGSARPHSLELETPVVGIGLKELEHSIRLRLNLFGQESVGGPETR